MTSPGGGAHVADVYADVLPDTSRFAAALKSELGRLPTPQVQVRADPDVTGFNRTLKSALTALPREEVKVNAAPDLRGFNTALRAQLAALPAVGTRANVDVNANTASATADLTALDAIIKRLDGRTIDLRVNARTGAAMADLAALRAAASGAASTISINVTMPNAAAIGTRVGTAAAAAFSAAFNAAIRNAPTPSVPGPGPARSAAAGATDGGAYARTFRAATDDALRNMPTPRLSLVRLPDVDRELNALRRDLATLNNQRIGIDIDAATALAEVRRIQTELARLGAQHPNVQVRADTAAASLRLSLLEAQLARIGQASPTARANVDTGNAINGMRFLIGAVQIFGSVAVPVFAAAAAAAASMVGVLASAGVGVGVGVLALSGVVGAVKALNTAKNDSAKTNATLARQDKQIAGGADQVRSAVASLANTRANAASAARHAAQQIQDAERGLAQAHQAEAAANRAVLEAQQEINKAREDAKRAAEDLTSEVANNALAIRQANLDVADAKKALDKVLGDRSATERQRIDAQLTYDKAAQQLDDLTLRQGRLATEKAAADKAGVEGSDQVRAAVKRVADAQQNVVDAQSKVHDAERAVTEARISAADQQRQAAYSVAQAQQAIVAAQRSMATAAVTTGATAGAAMDKLQQSMDGLSPAGRSFAAFLFGLKAPLLELRREAETGFLPGLQSGITALLPFQVPLMNFVGNIARGLGDIAERSANALKSDTWRPFFTYLDTTAVPTIRSVASILGDVATGFANIIVAFLPMQRSVVGGLTDIADRFARWSSTLQTNRGFQDFLDYVLTRGPVVMTTLGDLVGTIVRIGQSAAPVGDVVLTLLRGISGAIDAVPLPVLTAIVGGIAAFRIAGIIAPRVEAFATAIRSVATSSTGARTALGGVVGFLGGPWQAAITIAVASIGFLIGAAQKQKQKTDENVDALRRLGEAYKETGDFSSERVRQTVKESEGLQDLAINFEKYTKFAGDVAGSMGASKEAADAYGTSLGDLGLALNGNADSQKKILDVLNTVIALSPDTKLADQARARKTELEKLFISQKVATDADNKLTDAQRQQTDAAVKLQPEIDALQGLYDTLANKAATAAQTSDALRKAIGFYTDTQKSAIEAVERQSSTLDDYTTKLRLNGTELDISKGKTEEQRQKIRENRDALEAALTATRDKMLADIDGGMALDQAAEANKRRIDQILKEIPETERNSRVVQDLVAAYGDIPAQVKTAMKVDGVDIVMQQLKNLKAAQLALNENMAPQDAYAKISNNNIYRAFAASGGYIRGPGTTTSDSIPAMLSDQEFVQQASAVEHYGVPFMHALNQKRIPKQLLPGYAAGGLVARLASGGLVEEWDFPVNVSKTRIPSLDEVRSKVLAAVGASFGAGPGFGSWPSSPSAQRGDSGVWRSIVALIRSTGPLSGSFGNSYRPGDPLWHGSGRAVDWMGFNQDALAGFLAARRPLELIHRTAHRDYAYTRGVDKGSFNQSLMEAHRNHVHIAMADGGLVDIPYHKRDQGGYIPPGLSLVDNQTGRDEWIYNEQQNRALVGAAAGRGDGPLMHIDEFHAHGNQDPYDIARDLDWQLRSRG